MPTSRPLKPRDENDPRPVLLLDQTFSSESLRAALSLAVDWRIELHSDHWRGDEPDHEWVPVAAAARWMVLTADKRMRTHRNESGLSRAACIAACAHVFVAVLDDRPLADYAFDIGSARAKMISLSKKHNGSWFFARIHRGGRVQLGDFDRTKTKTQLKYGTSRSHELAAPGGAGAMARMSAGRGRGR